MYLAVRLGLQDSAAKELQREVAAHSGFDLFFSLLPQKVGGSCSFRTSIRSHSCPEASLPVISPLVLLPCYGSKAKLISCEQQAPLSGKMNG